MTTILWILFFNQFLKCGSSSSTYPSLFAIGGGSDLVWCSLVRPINWSECHLWYPWAGWITYMFQELDAVTKWLLLHNLGLGERNSVQGWHLLSNFATTREPDAFLFISLPNTTSLSTFWQNLLLQINVSQETKLGSSSLRDLINDVSSSFSLCECTLLNRQFICLHRKS